MRTSSVAFIAAAVLCLAIDVGAAGQVSTPTQTTPQAPTKAQTPTKAPRVPATQKATPPAAKTPTKPMNRGPRVLLRRINKGSMAMDGALFSIDVDKAAANPGTQRVQLRLAATEEEFCGQVQILTLERQQTPCEENWKKDPAAFEFLVTLTVDSEERSKSSMSDPVVVAVKEEWKVEKPSDPSVTKTWTLANQLTKQWSEDYKPAAEKSVKDAVAPARGPVLDEIRVFLLANRSK